MRGEIRVKKSVASPFRPQRTMRTQTDGKTESRSHPGTGCLPLWQTNPPIWRLVITRMEMKREDKKGMKEGEDQHCVLVFTSKQTVFMNM